MCTVQNVQLFFLPNSDHEQACRNNSLGQTSKNTSQNNWHFATIDEIPSVP
jgi:hypothetical protein